MNISVLRFKENSSLDARWWDYRVTDKSSLEYPAENTCTLQNLVHIPFEKLYRT